MWKTIFSSLIKMLLSIGSSMDSKNENYELEIYAIDQKLLKAGAKKYIDTKNLSKFENKKYDKKYEKNVKQILK